MLRVIVASVSLAVAAGLVAHAAPAWANPPYASCADAADNGRYNIPSDDPAYSVSLDRDRDGIACESE